MDTDRSQLLNALLKTSIPDESKSAPSLNEITKTIIGCAYQVGNTLGCGFLEKVYENALCHELQKKGLNISQQHELCVYYDNIAVGNYCADVVVENSVLIELKAVRDLNDVMLAQCINYLKATGYKFCLLINFGNPRVEVKRIAL